MDQPSIERPSRKPGRAFSFSVQQKQRPRRSGALISNPEGQDYLILASLNSTCLRTTGSYLLKLNFSVLVRGFFLVT